MQPIIETLKRLTGNRRGLSLVELSLVAALFSILILVVGRAMVGTGKSITQTRVKEQVLDFAQGELDNFARKAKAPNPVNGAREPYGYWQYVLSENETLVAYPRGLTEQDRNAAVANTGVDNPNRYMLLRTVDVSTFVYEADGSETQLSDTAFDPNRPGEYRRVVVTLKDSLASARFSPVVLETKIRRPHINALDYRQTDNAYLRGRVMVPNGTGGLDPLENSYVRVGPGDHFAASGQDGRFQVEGLNNLSLFTATVTSSNYWPGATSFTLSNPGLNTPASLNDIVLQPVKRATVTVMVTDKDTGRPLPGAKVSLFHPGPLPSDRYTANSYSRLTDGSGAARFLIAIPQAGLSNYDGFQVQMIERDGYIAEPSDNGYIQPHAFRLDGNSAYTYSKALYSLKFATVNVRVVEDTASMSPINGANIGILEELWGWSYITKAWTVASGTVTFLVPMNSMAQKDALTRTVDVVARRLAYQGSIRRQFDLDLAQAHDFVFKLKPHRFVVFFEDPALDASSPGNRMSIPEGARLHRTCVGHYFGHDYFPEVNTGELRVNWQLPWGTEEMDREYRWHSSGKIRLDGNPGDMARIIEGRGVGKGEVECSMRFHFKYKDGETELAPLNVTREFDMTADRTGYFDVTDQGEGPGTGFHISIHGPSEIIHGTTARYGADTNYVADSVSWEIVSPSPGRITETYWNEYEADLETTGGSVGDIIMIRARATLQGFPDAVSDPFPVKIVARPPAQASIMITCGGSGGCPDQSLLFNRSLTFGVVTQNMPSDARVVWTQVTSTGDELSAGLGGSLWGNLSALDGPTTTFQAGQYPGVVTIRTKIVAPDGQVLDWDEVKIAVVPSGGLTENPT